MLKRLAEMTAIKAIRRTLSNQERRSVNDAESLSASLRLRVASRGLQLVGLSGILAVLAVLGVIFWSGEPLSELTQRPWDLALALSTCVGFIVTGKQLRERRRSAGIVAIGTFLLPLISVAFGSLAFTIPTVALSILSAALVASTWKELNE